MKKYFRKEGGEMFRKKVMMFLTGSLLMLVSSVPAWGSAVPPESSVQAEADISGDADERRKRLCTKRKHMNLLLLWWMPYRME